MSFLCLAQSVKELVVESGFLRSACPKDQGLDAWHLPKRASVCSKGNRKVTTSAAATRVDDTLKGLAASAEDCSIPPRLEAGCATHPRDGLRHIKPLLSNLAGFNNDNNASFSFYSR